MRLFPCICRRGDNGVHRLLPEELRPAEWRRYGIRSFVTVITRRFALMYHEPSSSCERHSILTKTNPLVDFHLSVQGKLKNGMSHILVSIKENFNTMYLQGGQSKKHNFNPKRIFQLPTPNCLHSLQMWWVGNPIYINQNFWL